MKKTNMIYEETQRESIINRPHNLFGSVKPITKERFCIFEDKILLKDSTVTPALIKIFMEAVDNPVDIAIKYKLTNLTIDIKITDEYIEVKDNGPGIPNIKCADLEEYLIFKAFCKYNTSSNYNEFKNQGQKGVNGIGIKGSNTLSTKFIGSSDDGKTKVTVTATENNLNHTIKEEKTSGTSGVTVKFFPDFKIINGSRIDSEHIQRMYEYVLMQSLTYPNISFKFNGKRVNYTSKKFLTLFGNEYILEDKESYFLSFLPNETDNFLQLSFVNGLETSKGGTHIDYIVNNVVKIIREKLIKKYKTIKPADIKNKLTFVLVAKDVREIDWDGQTKESITTPNKYWIEYFKDIDFEKLANKILKTPSIIDSITEVYKIKEELLKRQEMKGLDKTVKKIKSDKYLPSIGDKRYLLLVEGESALGGLSPVLGRKNCGYYVLKGKPLNAYSAPQSKFVANKELSELYKIIQNENYEYVIYATDQDLDGYHIRGLLTGFFVKYLPELKGKLGMLQTPVITLEDSKGIKKWFYNLKEAEDIVLKSGEKSFWRKGLGSWDIEDLKMIVEKDGITKMIDMIEFDNEKIIDDWLGDDSEPRKVSIMKNDFSIAKS